MAAPGGRERIIDGAKGKRDGEIESIEVFGRIICTMPVSFDLSVALNNQGGAGGFLRWPEPGCVVRLANVARASHTMFGPTHHKFAHPLPPEIR